MPLVSIWSPEKVSIDMGTFCESSERRVEVTMTSSRPPESFEAADSASAANATDPPTNTVNAEVTTQKPWSCRSIAISPKIIFDSFWSRSPFPLPLRPPF
jgi:hypothetical protein